MKPITYVHCVAIFFLLFISSCREEKDLVPPDFSQPPVQNNDITLTALKNNAAADGVQYNEFLIKVDNALKGNFSEVNFEISPDAKFSNGAATQKVPIDVNGEAIVYAQSTRVGPATVRATVGTYSKQVTATFEKAWPDQIIVEADSVFLSALPGMNTAVRARLSRTSGTISPGIVVSFFDSTGVAGKQSIGVFLNTTVSDATGMVNTRYWLQDSTHHNDVYLIATVQAPNGEKRARTRIRIR